jgi:hypothetical protein
MSFLVNLVRFPGEWQERRSVGSGAEGWPLVLVVSPAVSSEVLGLNTGGRRSRDFAELLSASLFVSGSMGLMVGLLCRFDVPGTAVFLGMNVR